MRKDENIYIKHILERSEKIIRFTDGMDEDEFLNDDKTQSAVIREFEVIGEATKKYLINLNNNIHKSNGKIWQV